MKRLLPIILTLFVAVWFSPAQADTIRLVAFGDSLTAGYGLAQSDSYPSRLQAALRDKGYDVEIANAGVSGDTASAAARRIDWSVSDDTQGVIVVLGGNDILRGVDTNITRDAMERIVTSLKDRDLSVLLGGMRAPANLGADFAAQFDTIFTDLAREHDVIFQPFFLDGVATVASLNQSDGIHPNAAGIDVIVDQILPYAVTLVEQIRNSR